MLVNSFRASRIITENTVYSYLDADHIPPSLYIAVVKQTIIL